MNSPMTGWGDKVEQSMNPIVTETWVTLDTGLLCKNIIVLSLKVSYNLAETRLIVRYWWVFAEASQVISPCFIINLIPKARCIDDGERDASSFFIQLQLCVAISNVAIKEILRILCDSYQQ